MLGNYRNQRCKMCSQKLIGKRRDSKYCGANCRKRASRWAQRLNQDAREVAWRIRSLQEFLDDEEHKARAVGVLHELRAQIDDMLGVTIAAVTHTPNGGSVTVARVTDDLEDW
jgi:hypothetical protein